MTPLPPFLFCPNPSGKTWANEVSFPHPKNIPEKSLFRPPFPFWMASARYKCHLREKLERERGVGIVSFSSLGFFFVSRFPHMYAKQGGLKATLSSEEAQNWKTFAKNLTCLANISNCLGKQ